MEIQLSHTITYRFDLSRFPLTKRFSSLPDKSLNNLPHILYSNSFVKRSDHSHIQTIASSKSTECAHTGDKPPMVNLVTKEYILHLFGQSTEAMIGFINYSSNLLDLHPLFLESIFHIFQ